MKLILIRDLKIAYYIEPNNELSMALLNYLVTN